MDFFSRVHFSIPLLIYIPVILFLLYQSLFTYHLSIFYITTLFFCGALVWTFVEYFMHRFVFHYEPSSELGKRLHFMSHGVHHDYPNDSLRLVMPPAISVPLAFVFYWLFSFLFADIGVLRTFFAGFMAGYLTYDMMHYATHHSNFKNPLFRMLKKHHMKHHYGDPDHGYGVSSKLWDFLFRSDFPK